MIKLLFAWMTVLLAFLIVVAGCSVPGKQGVQPATAATDSTDTSQRAFRARLVGLWDQEKYAELDAIADQLRTQRLRFKGGAWQLHEFYATLSSPGSASTTDAEWQAQIDQLRRWIKDSPASPTPRVALAQTYVRFAWKARGNGFSDTVTPEARTLFQQRVQAAREVLEDEAKLGSRDPGGYRQMQTVALAQQWKRPQFDALTDEATAADPGYFYFAIAEANYLLPKWYGQPGDTERYAGKVADQVGGAEGAAVYFRIAAAMNCCRSTQAPAMSWPRVQEGFASIDRTYGSINHQRNVMAYLAVRAGDLPTANRLFAQIGADWDAKVWKTKARYEAGRSGNDLTAPSVESDDEY